MPNSFEVEDANLENSNDLLGDLCLVANYLHSLTKMLQVMVKGKCLSQISAKVLGLEHCLVFLKLEDNILASFRTLDCLFEYPHFRRFNGFAPESGSSRPSPAHSRCHVQIWWGREQDQYCFAHCLDGQSEPIVKKIRSFHYKIT